MHNRRRHTRFSPTAFLNRPVLLKPVHPFFGHPVKGKLIDLSAGGMAIFIDEIIPRGAHLTLRVTFPDQFKIETEVDIKYVMPREGKYVHGIEFLSLPAEVAARIDAMSTDYIDCESRIAAAETEICRTQCAFFTMCNKPQKLNPVLDSIPALELTFTQPTHV
jgi:hypothetical protein